MWIDWQRIQKILKHCELTLCWPKINKQNKQTKTSAGQMWPQRSPDYNR